MSLQKVSIFMIERQTIIRVRGCMVRSLLWSLVALGISFSWLFSLACAAAPGVEYSFLYRDANAISGNPFYRGMLEKLTFVLMISSGSVLLFTALMG